MNQIKQIDELYQEAEKNGFDRDHIATKELDRVSNLLPDKFWIE